MYLDPKDCNPLKDAQKARKFKNFHYIEIYYLPHWAVDMLRNYRIDGHGKSIKREYPLADEELLDGAQIITMVDGKTVIINKKT